MRKKVEKNNKDLFNKALNHAYYFLKFRERSEKEVRQNLASYLKKKKIEESIILKIVSEVIDYLKERTYIDDLDFAKNWILKRTKGKKVLIFELKQKGISQEIIEKVIDSQEFKGSQVNAINKIFQKSTKKYANLPYPKNKEKIILFMLRKGFNYSAIQQLVDEFLKKQ